MTEIDKEAARRRFFFRKENRLLKRAEFLHVYNHGKPYRRSLVHVFILKPDTASAGAGAGDVNAGDAPAVPAPQSAWLSSPCVKPTRLGITATKKTGNAVRRNRGRRLVRESFRLALPDMQPGYSMVVNLTRKANQAPFANIDAQLRDIWQAAGILPSGHGVATQS